MQDTIRYTARNFDASLPGAWFAVPVHQAQIWSVQVIVKTAITNCVLELLMSNDGRTGVVFSPARQWTAAGFQTGIDCGGLGISHVIFSVNDKADTAAERVDVIFVGRTDNGTGQFTDLELATKPA